MKRQYLILSILLLAIIVSASIYGSYSLFYASPQSSPALSSEPSASSTVTPTSSASSTPETTETPNATTTPTTTASASPTPTATSEPENKTVTIVDATGTQWSISAPVDRVVSLNAGLTQIVCALGCEDTIVGRSATSVFPDSILDVPEVGSSSASPNVELLLETNPDIVLADTMLSSKTDIIKQITDAGIPVIIVKTTYSDQLKSLVTDISQLLGADAEEKATELTDWMDQYINLVSERVANLTTSEMPTVYFEWSSDDWKGINPYSGLGGLITNAGGINIVVSNSTSTSTLLSPEYVIESNPDFIIKQSSSTNNSITDLMTVQDSVLSRSVLSEINAVKNGNVCILNYRIDQGIEYPIGQLYIAKWLHPDLFADIDVTAIHAEMLQKFFGVTLGDAYAYPLA